jgi:GH35 family endo-1,4-beta-xylanase
MTALCQRYDKQPSVRWMDVINEAITQKGEWFGPAPGVEKWENPWPKIGYDESHPLRPPLYIKLAFEIANRHAPNTKLIINQHGGMEAPMWDKVKATVRYLRNQGLRVDGLGWQAHIDVGWELEGNNLQRLSELIDWSHANGLSFHITENNVWLKREKDYTAQADTFAAIVRTLLSKRHTGVVTWNVWNLSDADQWSRTRDWNGCLLYEDFSAKPAYYAIQKELMTSSDN